MAITSNYVPTPAPMKQALVSSYIDFTANGFGWAQQYVPDLMEQEAEVFGNRTISGFLSQIGAEEAMTADQVIWSEQSRLHLSYTVTVAGTNGITMTATHDADGTASTTGTFSTGDHGMRAGDMVLLADADKTVRAYVSAVAANGTCSIQPYGAAHMTDAGIANQTGVKCLVFGSEYSKGNTGRGAVNEPRFKQYNNKPIIIKDKYEISGSDASQIGWVEVTGEDGQNGYLWYLKAAGDTRSRFADYLEMAMIESEKATGDGKTDLAELSAGSNTGAVTGTEGLFSALGARGNETTGVSGVNAATDLAEFDAILAELDKNGAIEENMMFLNRTTALAIDDMLATMNSYGAGGTSYGVFNNSEDMALNLGFSGFRRGSYDFYKSDMKYLNDKSTRGGNIDTVNAIRGVVIPAGVSSVYDQQLGKNLKRPFLHVRYRSSATDDRRMKTWTTGSVGAVTSDLDAMEMHFLSERCLVVQGANNFFLMN